MCELVGRGWGGVIEWRAEGMHPPSPPPGDQPRAAQARTAPATRRFGPRSAHRSKTRARLSHAPPFAAHSGASSPAGDHFRGVRSWLEQDGTCGSRARLLRGSRRVEAAHDRVDVWAPARATSSCGWLAPTPKAGVTARRNTRAPRPPCARPGIARHNCCVPLSGGFTDSPHRIPRSRHQGRHRK